MQWCRGIGRQRLIGKGWPALLLLLGSGCSLVPVSSPAQAALSAPPAVKRQIYREITATIADSRRQGAIFLNQGDLSQALACYRRAAFYEPTPELLQKVSELQAKISADSKRLVAKGQASLARNDGEAALKTFNQALRLTPENEEARSLRDRLLARPRFQAELAAREAALRRSWKNYSARPPEMVTLAEQSAAVLEYDADNPLALKVEQQVEQQRQEEVRLHLKEGMDSYRAGDLEQAELFAQKARDMAPDDPKVLVFLQEIKKEQNSDYFLQLARQRLERDDPDQAEGYAQKALALDPHQEAAEAIIQEVRLERFQGCLAQAKASFSRGDYEDALLHLQRVLEVGPRCQKWQELRQRLQKVLNQQIPVAIDQAQKLFTENKLRQANRVLARVVELDPDNRLAATYLKKVQSRLATIESLQ